jgi:hypothetical protein
MEIFIGVKHQMLVDDVPPRKETSKARDSRKIEGVVIGRLADLAKPGGPFVDFPGNPSAKPLPALSVVSLAQKTVGRRVVLMFEEGDPQRPVVMGVVKDHATLSPKPVELLIDKKRFVFTAEEEIVLRCGKSSITLTRAGKVLIRGAYLLNRSSGVNRIKGGSVQIN